MRPLFDLSPQISSSFDPGSSIVWHHGDVSTLLESIPDGTVKLVVTSPPYNVGKEYETRTSIQEYLARQSKIIKDLVRVVAPDGSICWQVGNYVEKGEVYPLDIYYYGIFPPPSTVWARQQ